MRSNNFSTTDKEQLHVYYQTNTYTDGYIKKEAICSMWHQYGSCIFVIGKTFRTNKTVLRTLVSLVTYPIVYPIIEHSTWAS